jgi:hypothetical protein
MGVRFHQVFPMPSGRHRRDQYRQNRGDQADQHHRLAAQVVGCRLGREAADAEHEGGCDGDPADVGLCQRQRLLGQHQQRAGDRQIVALDKADQGEHGDDQYVVGAERDAVKFRFLAENVLGLRVYRGLAGFGSGTMRRQVHSLLLFHMRRQFFAFLCPRPPFWTAP